MIKPILNSVLAMVTCLMTGACFAQDMENMTLGNCGFAGSDFMTNHYSCHQIQRRSDNGIRKEALLQLASAAWGLITGQDSDQQDAADNFGKPQASLNEGQKLEPRFSLSAQSDEVLFTVAYEF